MSPSFLEKDLEVHHDETKADNEIYEVSKTGNHDKIIAALADEILPGVELNTDPAFEKALVRKFDRRLLLMMMAIYIMNYLDRGNIAYAASGTLKKRSRP